VNLLDLAWMGCTRRFIQGSSAHAPVGAAAVGAVVAAIGCPTSLAVAAELPQYAQDAHAGVASCSGTACHGAARPGKHAVTQSEYHVWRGEGGDVTHATAYDVLLNDLSKRIARNLGLKRPAHEEPLCLDCHADNVPAEKRGAKFQLEDGVGCEACHGGSERYLKPHDAGQLHAKNVALGMYPSDNPVARAELCLSCHFGNAQKFVDHRLMGAGHPRQSFELVLFTEIQPRHFEVDEDWVARGKAVNPSVLEWSLGQAVAVREILAAILDPKRSRHGIWPEFVLFDCHACHHEMSNQRWRPRPSTGLGPGLARLNDANFLMLRQALRVVDPDAAEAFRVDLRALHRATASSGRDQQTVARRMHERVNASLGKLLAWKVDRAADIIFEAVDNVGSPETFDPAFIVSRFKALQPLLVAPGS
jgi:hypothetical protein